ncbi:E3 ubiquitin-protein ligase UBR2 [Copidosoma floridanum]|uniref:E3 ubiquitin-protein ligase UBR2 n=1 Tax=Copidosoma floridanum TaxID=29053 RepID=UPI0006C9D57B|nr:E3 ubiquitin-protein ligase UBR2 [Copidosoma floridanum]XP_014208995.1 E3 ubiquitin-protein ligase UBR2 [Copidosoma floridanum]XP_014208998.1 E3 ubiquitin-protein ligase UBR2 [Copidosoma floridanum]XP_014209006.1 E3 ubiquitin-protein ligase UBR2 [Copidosoma floridanum]XP_014209013.1 E3 ubiquitin-protein ligase UBR2 [Copidosoma floridanum]XP_014209021.1 E3 ubiquitin-protein ligase UBR2 [Copidosoma floridanum]XP_023246799.1 E3 ubiquitin-protein ligase UBR2 [Copidosoma floridanum]XP_02324680
MSKESEDPEGHSIADVELSLTMPIIKDSPSPVQVWMEKMDQGILSNTHFKEYWRIWVPKIYRLEPTNNCLEWIFDEEDAQEALYDPLEEFICNGNPREILKQLNQNDRPPSICGRVFKTGDSTYSCRECGMDSTCVLCVDCFKQSAHKNHKYKMGISIGGGCCDCGDVEAWKKEPFCKIHLVGIEVKDAPSNRLPDDMSERAAITFQAVLKYCYDLLSMEHSPGLPADLCVKESTDDLYSKNDTYCTVLFNDESHTFDQVIVTLTRSIACTQREAIEYVSNIDREGRAVVKCSDFQHCNELKQEIEKFTSRHNNRPLKVLVKHAHVVAHQIFAMKLLGWLQQFISHCEGFRTIFSQVVLNAKHPDLPILKGILLRDFQLWKSARACWHRLFISGMLTEYENKKSLAVVFTQNYGNVLKDFINDDHDHPYSIASMSVQLFTVPTLAHLLIAQHDALHKLLNTFISESQCRCNPHGKLEFDRNSPNNAFKRALYILYDLRYLLSAKPETWTNELRRGFLDGMQRLMQLLNMMQWMDAVVRQVGQHMEYEQEWESAFNLHIKLSPVISLALEWCGSDSYVLIRAFRLVLQKLEEQPGKAHINFREVANHCASCIHYDVSTEPVSIHLPLSRFLAGLFLHLEKHNLSFQGSEIISKVTIEELIEPVLRAQAMVSQVQAQMWRRNGYSLIHQLYFYHNVKCRTEMLDKDIVLLQAGAALIESNEFIIHILNKFNLVNWAQTDFESALLKTSEEDSIRQTINLVEEFLGLLITIIGERYMPGVGQVTPDDCLKHEIIQQLCISPMSHSELNKTLPEGVHHETGMERVINEVADFVKPKVASAGKGVYKLKPECYSEYNVFFYHYTKEELSKSEEAQRKRRKANNELECCPPPRLPRLTEMFNLVTNLLQCDVMLSMISLVLTRTLDLKARSFSEAQVHKVLHLIGYALQEQESGYYPFLNFTERAAQWDIYSLLKSVSSSPRIESHKDLLTWVLEKYSEVTGSNAVKTESTSPEPTKSEESKSSGSQEWRMKMAAKKRAQVMAQMAAMQKHFMNKNAELFEEAGALDSGVKTERGSAMDLSESLDETLVALGPRQTNRFCHEKSFTCILCQENQPVKADLPALVLAAFVQQSTVLCQLPPRERSKTEPTSLYLSSHLGASPHASTCGHVMHAACWQRHFDNVLTKENRRPYRLRQPVSFDVEKHEYLCPLCECLSNTVMPLLPSIGLLQPTPTEQPELTFDQWLDIMSSVCKCKGADEKNNDYVSSHDESCRYCKLSSQKNPEVEAEAAKTPQTRPNFVSCPIEAIKSHGELGDALLKLYSQPGPQLSTNLIEMIELFTQTTYTKGLKCDPDDSDPRVPLLAWQSTAYTVHAIEFLLRETDKPLLGALSSRQRDSIEGLARISAMVGATWPSKSTQSTSPTGVCSENIAEFALSCLSRLLDDKNSSCDHSILSWDPFGMIVTLISSMANLFSANGDNPSIITGNIAEIHAVRLVFTALVVKILLLSNFEEDEKMDIDDDIDSDVMEKTDEIADHSALAAVLNSLNVKTGKLSLAEIWKRVKECCGPFLRCCILYFHYVTDVPAPVELTVRGGDTYENICRYLGLPESSASLFDSDKVLQLAVQWSKHPGMVEKDKAVREPLKINRLVELPDDYSELMNQVSMFTCPNSDKEDSRNPTKCLVCGHMLCSQSYCCQTDLNNANVGACTKHASQCGAGVGVFLRVRDCEIIFLRSPYRGSYGCPPYLDEYGETDQGLHRGNPLKLCPEKYQRLNEMWLSHGLYETIARATESSNSASGQWQHF